MPGYNQQQIDPQVLSGNQVAILAGEQLIGFGQSADPSIDFGAEFLYGIGSAKPQEIQQFKIGSTISLSKMMLTDHGIALVGSSTPWVSILANNDIDLHMMDPNGKPILTYVGCVAGSVSMNIPANQPVTENTSFMAIDVLGPDGSSVLRSNDAAQFNAVASTAAATAIGALNS